MTPKRQKATQPQRCCSYWVQTSHLPGTLPCMAGDLDRNLLEMLEIRLDEVLRYDLLVAVLAAGAGVWLALEHPELAVDAAPTAAGLVGVVIGAVVAGVAILAAFMDQVFLRKLAAIGRQPTRYLAPFVFTASLGVCAALSSLALAATSPAAPSWFLAPLTALAAWFSVWTLVSLLPLFKLLMDFVGLKTDAAAIPDDAVEPRIGRRHSSN